MINILILFLIIAGLIIHRYLSTFWEQGMLPYSFGFLFFANLFFVVCLINFVWMLGFLIGIIVSASAFFQVIYSSYLWFFLLPFLININKQPSIPKVSPFVYGIFSFIVIILGILAISNFFISDYMSLLRGILRLFDYNYKLIGLLLIGSMVISNIIRKYTLSKFLIPRKPFQINL